MRPPEMSGGVGYSHYTLHGDSAWSAERVIQAVESGARLSELPGDFTAIASGEQGGEPRLKIVTSMVAARPYFMCRTPAGRLVHGSTVFDVVREARLPWRWNRRAIVCLALFGHTAGEDTLHAQVTRVPYATTITARGNELAIQHHDREWSEVFEARRAVSLDEAVSVLDAVFAENVAQSPVVSLSAGFDSRLLLALALRHGRRPLALTMGHGASTDVIVARQIAERLGLEHRVIELGAPDYLRHARAIVAATSGTKTAAHWHTDLYVRNAGLERDAVHYVGSNGEFARSFFFDAGGLARAAAAGPSALVTGYFAARLARRARRFPPALLAEAPGPLSCARHAARATVDLTKGFLDGLDCFYATQRVRHFIGNGLALYAQHCAPRSPFLDGRWIRAVAALPRHDRLGSNYHRRAIAAFQPRLLDFPAGAEPTMAAAAPPFYYLRRARAVGYSPFGQVAADPATRELIVEASGLDELLPRNQRLEAIDKHPASIELLLTLAVAADLAREATS